MNEWMSKLMTNIVIGQINHTIEQLKEHSQPMNEWINK